MKYPKFQTFNNKISTIIIRMKENSMFRGLHLYFRISTWIDQLNFTYSNYNFSQITGENLFPPPTCTFVFYIYTCLQVRPFQSIRKEKTEHGACGLQQLLIFIIETDTEHQLLVSTSNVDLKKSAIHVFYTRLFMNYYYIKLIRRRSAAC